MLDQQIEAMNWLVGDTSIAYKDRCTDQASSPHFQSHQPHPHWPKMLLSTVIPYLCLAATGLAAVIPETNGDRLRRGLTPKQPVRRYDASRTHCRSQLRSQGVVLTAVGHHARASGSPSATAYLEALDSNSNPIGYLYKVNGTFGLTTGVSCCPRPFTEFGTDPTPF